MCPCTPSDLPVHLLPVNRSLIALADSTRRLHSAKKHASDASRITYSLHIPPARAQQSRKAKAKGRDRQHGTYLVRWIARLPTYLVSWIARRPSAADLESAELNPRRRKGGAEPKGRRCTRPCPHPDDSVPRCTEQSPRITPGRVCDAQMRTGSCKQQDEPGTIKDQESNLLPTTAQPLPTTSRA